MSVATESRPTGRAEQHLQDERLHRRRRGILMRGVVTLFALGLLLTYLMPLAFGGVTSLKTKEQASEPGSPILPVVAESFVHDGETYPLYQVPMPGGTTRELAMTQRGRDASTFIDPEAPGAGPIEWEGRWRTLQPVSTLEPQWSNYPEAWNRINFARLLGWTLFYSITTLIATVVSSAVVAYGFARFEFPYKRLLFGLLLSTIILPPAVTLVPRYALFLHLGWIGTYAPLIVPQMFANAYNVFLLRQYFLTIPRELEEAARVDGAGPIRTFLKVIVPQAIPALVAVSLFHFFYAWNDFFEPLLYLAGNRAIVPISVGLTYFSGVYAREPQFVLAAAFLALAIPLLIFFLAQRVFIQGIVITGVDK